MNEWLENGRYYGYPECCIDEFINLKKYPIIDTRKFSGTGYRPCKDCNKKTESELKNEINKNRSCMEPFPPKHCNYMTP